MNNKQNPIPLPKPLNTYSLGFRIKYFRIQKGWSQSELADRIDVHRGTVERWERNLHTPNDLTLYKLCDCLGVTQNTLLGINNS
jgi:transcriptional regulator with XRE-family HTH domain